MRRIVCTLTASAALTLAPAATASAWEGATASVSPSTAAPGATVEITVSCPKSDQESISADSQAFSGGSVQLDMYGGGGADPHGGQTQYRGSAVLAGASGFDGGGPDAVGGQSSWGIDGTCPDGEQWNTGVTVARHAWHGSKAGRGGSVNAGDAGQIALGTALIAGVGYVAWRRVRNPAAGS
ncbi:hypothetical protein [Streptomyces sp. NPDC058308]|uniref:hypothetical protein n=1 Tax=Streptomyces sp. NPDC058308 TaxID=3346440 RepID=UPI0036E95A32